MSKGNLFLGFGRGKLGDVVFSRQNGEQVARARNRSPRNPQTPLQLLQRVVMKSVSSAYSLLLPIADHSFQGLELGTPNQSRFVTRNVAMLREQLADVINSGEASGIISSTEANFNARELMAPLVNPWILSEGHLPSLGILVNSRTGTSGARPFFEFNAPAGSLSSFSPTYTEFVSAFGLQRGDQLTFCAIINDDSGSVDSDPAVATAFEFARIILEPSDGDMSKALFAAETARTVNDPNPRNEGTVIFETPANGVFQVSSVNGYTLTAGSAQNIVGMAVIVSRLQGNTWQRSSESFVLVPSGTGPTDGGTQYDYKTALLGDAVLSYMNATGSSLYLNQANGGF